MFVKQFFGTFTWPTIFAIGGVHIGAVFVRDSGLELPFIALLALLTVYFAYQKLEYGLYIAFAEIFVGGHGHLLSGEFFGFNVSLRIAIFGAVMLAWLIHLLQKRSKPTFDTFRDIPWAVLLVAVGIGSFIGFLQNDPGQAFDDMNGYVTIAYLLPLVSVKWNQKKKRELLQIFSASIVWLVFFTLLLSYLFTHLDGKSLNNVYTFVRDSRLAEITLQTVSDSEGNVVNPVAELFFGTDGYWYRIFMQSQFFGMTAILLLSALMFLMWRTQKLPWQASISFAAVSSIVLLSFSRSFLLGLTVGGLLLIVLSFTHGKKAVQSTVSRFIVSVLLFLLGTAVAWLTVVIPIPENPDISDAAFYSTSADSGRDLAVSSRWQLLGPMMDEIYTSPLLGSGFGKDVTFISDDPRVRAQNPSGEWTTYRFEWGYQDIWLKMGLLGLIAFGLYAYVITRAAIFTARNHGHKWLVFGFGAGLVCLYVSSAFSPFMNHPIGLGFMLFVIPFFDWEGLRKKVQSAENVQPIPKTVPEITPVMSVEE